jgi:hypothetical protein
MVFLLLTFIFNDPKSIITMLNYCHLRVSSVWCTNPQFHCTFLFCVIFKNAFRQCFSWKKIFVGTPSLAGGAIYRPSHIAEDLRENQLWCGIMNWRRDFYFYKNKHKGKYLRERRSHPTKALLSGLRPYCVSSQLNNSIKLQGVWIQTKIFIADLEASKTWPNLCCAWGVYVNRDGGLRFESFKNFHIKLNSNGSENHILIFYGYYSNYLQNLNEMWLKL